MRDLGYWLTIAAVCLGFVSIIVAANLLDRINNPSEYHDNDA